MTKKLRPKQPNLEQIHKLYMITKSYLKRNMAYPQIAATLYKSDKEKFQKAFHIIYGTDYPQIQDEFVARLLLQEGLKVAKLLEYSSIIGSKDVTADR